MHQVLYRMYRPKSFDEIYGQDHIVAILKNQIQTNSIGHAYLFTGPRGTGKTSTARIFAMELNHGSEMDIIELDAASHNKVEDIREIIDRLSLAPFEGKYKIYILDEVHMLSTAAANAFLKSLEEPPEHVIFILATTEPNKLPSTILSRTQRFDFNKITPDVIIRRLSVVLKEEGIAFSPEALDFIARKSDGGLRDALSLLDKAISYGELSPDNVAKALGSIQGDQQIQLIRSIFDNDTTQTILTLEAIREHGLDPKAFLFDVIECLRDSILVRNRVSLSNPAAEELALFLDDKVAAYFLEEFSKILGQLRFSPNPHAQLLADLVLLSSTKFDELDRYRQLPSLVKNLLNEQNFEIQQLRQKVASLESKWSSQETYPQFRLDNSASDVNNSEKTLHFNPDIVDNSSTSVVPSPQEMRSLDISEEEKRQIQVLADLFPTLKQRLKEIKRYNIYSVLMMATPKRFVGNNLFFVFEGENRGMLKMMHSTEPNKFVDPILSELLGTKIVTHYVTDQELADIPQDKWLALKNDIADAFPEVALEIFD